MDILKALNDFASLINFALLLVIIGFLFQLNNNYRANIKEQINTLKERLAKAEAEAPLAVTESLNRRVQITEDEIKRQQAEIERLTADHQEQLKRAKIELEERSTELARKGKEALEKQMLQIEQRLEPLFESLEKQNLRARYRLQTFQALEKELGIERLEQILGKELVNHLLE